MRFIQSLLKERLKKSMHFYMYIKKKTRNDFLEKIMEKSLHQFLEQFPEGFRNIIEKKFYENSVKF